MKRRLLGLLLVSLLFLGGLSPFIPATMLDVALAASAADGQESTLSHSAAGGAKETVPSNKIEVAEDGAHFTGYADFQTGWNAAVGFKKCTVRLLDHWTAADGSFGAGDGFSDGAICIPAGKDITLDLNGKTIDRALRAAKTTGCVISTAGALTAKNGQITGGWNDANGGGICAVGDLATASLKLENVEVLANKADMGGGVFSAVGIIMEGGRICGNAAASSAGGLVVAINNVPDLRGDVEISGNTAKGAASNFHRDASIDPDDRPPILVDKLGDNAHIGITVSLMEGARFPVDLTVTNDKDISARFFSDSDAYAIRDSGLGDHVVQAVALATVGDVTVKGLKGISLPDAGAVITLAADHFQAMALGTDVSAWFANLPAGLTAKTQAATLADAATAAVIFSGTPAELSEKAMLIKIPASALKGGKAITVAANANARWRIVTPKLTVTLGADTTAYGDFAGGWNAAVAAAKGSGRAEIKLLENWTAAGGSFGTGNGFSDGAIYVPEDCDVKLDLNGKTVDRGLKTAANNGCVIIVEADFTLCDSAGGGRITGGYNAGNGGGIFAQDHTGSAKITVQGGEISGNRANSGGGVSSLAPFFMEGGKITGNSADAEGGGLILGIDYEMSLGGDCVVTGNKAGGKSSNVHLYIAPQDPKRIDASGLRGGAKIGVTVRPAEGVDYPIVITDPSDDDHSACFTSDDAKFALRDAASGAKHVVQIYPLGAPSITTAALEDGAVGTAYAATLAATGDAPITWSLESGSLPAGLTLSAEGVVSGTPTAAGESAFTVKASNKAGSATKALAIKVAAAEGFLVTYDANGGAGAVPSDGTRYEANATVTVLFTPLPAREKATFSGWARSAAASDPEFTADGLKTFAINGDTTLYAVWQVVPDFVPVKRISGVPVAMEVGVPLPLTGTVRPANATNQKIVWSVSPKNPTEVFRAMRVKKGVLTTKHAGTVIVRATVKNGLAPGLDYVQDVPIKSETIVPTDITLDAETLTLDVGEKHFLTATVEPAGAVTHLAWKSSDQRVATVNDKGRVTGKAAGKATITVTTGNGLRASCQVTVVTDEPTGISLDRKKLALSAGEKYVFTATVEPAGAVTHLTWESSDKSVAIVNGKGRVTGKAAGRATITVTTGNGLSAKCTVTVEAEGPTAVSLNKRKLTMAVGRQFKLIATLEPAGATSKLAWKSSDKSIVFVNSDGRLTAKKKGVVTITVTTANGKTATCKVTVKT